MSFDEIVASLKDVVCYNLGLDGMVFENFIKNENPLLVQIKNLLAKVEAVNRDVPIFLYCVTQEEEVEIDAESSSEESEDEEGVSMDESEDDEEVVAITATPVSSYEEDLASTYIHQSTRQGTTEASSSRDEPTSSQKTEVTLQKKKIIKQLVMRQVLLASLDSPPLEAFKQPVMYLLPRPKEQVTTNDLSSLFEIGSLKGNIFESFKQLINRCYEPLIASHLLETFRKTDPEKEKIHLQVMNNFISLKKHVNQIKLVIENQWGDAFEIVPSITLLDEDLDPLESFLLMEEKLSGVVEIVRNQLIDLEDPANLSFWRKIEDQGSYILQQVEGDDIQELVSKVIELNQTTDLERFYSNLHILKSLTSKAEQSRKSLGLIQEIMKECVIGNSTVEIPMLSFWKSLGILWTMSREYGTPDKFDPLLNAYSRSIDETVLRKVALKKIFGLSNEEALSCLRSSEIFLEKWESTFHKWKSSFNESIFHAHSLDINQDQVFKTSRHIAVVSGKLGLLLKSAIDVCRNDPKYSLTLNEINYLENRNNLLQPIEELEYDIFNPRYKESWEKFFKKFSIQLSALKNVQKPEVDESETIKPNLEVQCFPIVQMLREDRLKGIESKDYADLIYLFIKEVSMVKGLVEVKEKPMMEELSFHSALLIIVEDSLETLSRSKTAPSHPQWLELNRICAELTAETKKSDENRIQIWKLQADSLIGGLLNRSLIAEIIEDGVRTLRPNIPDQLRTILEEVKLLNTLGFTLSDALQNAALLHDEFDRCEAKLRQLLLAANKLLNRFSDVQISQSLCLKLNLVIRRGVSSRTWSCISNSDYLTELGNVIFSTKALARLVQDELSRVSADVIRIGRCDLKTPAILCSGSESFEEYRTNYNKAEVDALEFAYSSVSYHLLRIEKLLFDRRTASCSELKWIYQSTERDCTEMVVQMTTRNLTNLLENINDPSKTSFLIKVTSENDINLTPSILTIYSLVTDHLKEILQCPKRLPLWLNGTCIGNPSSSHYQTICKDPRVRQLTQSIEETIRGHLGQVLNYLQSLKSLIKRWESNALERLESADSFEGSFAYFDVLTEEMASLNVERNFGSLSLSLEEFLAWQKSKKESWVRELTRFLSGQLERDVAEIGSEILEFERVLEGDVQTYEQRELLRGTVVDISHRTVPVMKMIKEMEEKSVLLSKHEKGKGMTIRVRKIGDRWKNLLEKSRQYSSCLFWQDSSSV